MKPFIWAAVAAVFWGFLFWILWGKGIVQDFIFMHADVLRNTIALFFFSVSAIIVTVLLTRWQYRKKAMKEAREDLKQHNVELTIENKVLRETKAEQWREIERLTIVQNAAVGAANTVHEVVKEGPR